MRLRGVVVAATAAFVIGAVPERGSGEADAGRPPAVAG